MSNINGRLKRLEEWREGDARYRAIWITLPDDAGYFLGATGETLSLAEYGRRFPGPIYSFTFTMNRPGDTR